MPFIYWLDPLEKKQLVSYSRNTSLLLLLKQLSKGTQAVKI